MLLKLKIDNYALIDRLRVETKQGLSVITGETGAGKSIILGALSLVLGNRADSKTILPDASKCVVEAEFDIEKLDLKPIFEKFEIDYFDQCIIRREVCDNGKSRAFINDTPVNLLQLKELCSMLIDIHSQHSTLLLSNNSFQLDIVDKMANTEVELNRYTELYNHYQQKKAELNRLKTDSEKSFSDKEYFEFQLNQLLEAELAADEQEQLEDELKVINHSGDIAQALSTTYQILSGDQYGAENQLYNGVGLIKKVMDMMPEIAELFERINSSFLEVKDISAEIQKLLSRVEYSPDRKIYIEERLNNIYLLEQKHKVDSIDKLIDIQRDFENKLTKIANFDQEIDKIAKEIDKTEKALNDVAELLFIRRKGVKREIESKIEGILLGLGMPNAKFEVMIVELENFTPTGKQRIDFLFSANKNIEPQKIGLIASGGEMSRLMLAIKSIVIDSKALPTIIFDEIDSGISGEIAKKMGEILCSMAKTRQVITITHTPQIASKGATHYKVYKKDDHNRSKTDIVELLESERIEEIAEMIAGKNPSKSALDSAKELLLNRS